MAKSLFQRMIDGELPYPQSTQTLGTKILEVSTETKTIEVEFEGKPEFANPIGNMQGGFLAAMLDETMGLSIAALLEDNDIAPTLELKVNFFAPAKAGKLKALGTVVSKGGSVCFLEAELRQGEKLIAKSTATALILRAK